MKQRYRRQPPAEDQHGASHLRGAAVDDKEHDQQEAEKPRDDQRCWNDMAPCPRGPAPEIGEEYDRRAESS